MKKKLLTLLLVCAMALSFSLVSFADDGVSATVAISAVKKGEAYIIDVRCDAKRAEVGNLDHLSETYVIHKPVFDANNKLDTDEAKALQAEFTNYVTANKATLSEKPIYILCNSGKGGAAKADELLSAAGYTNYTKIIGGATGAELELRYALLNVNNTISGSKALENAAQNDNIVILDVRNDERYAAGHLAGSIHIAVFDAENKPVTTANDPLAQDFINAAKDNAELTNKTIYVLCNGGQRGARAATVLLKDAGYPVDKIYTITGGAGDSAIKPVLVPTVTEYKFVENADAVKAMTDDKVVIIDVRTEANFKKGSITEINWPLFNDKGVTNGRDDLAKAFLKNVEDNAALLEGKDIYILCNSGARGAQNATQLLAHAGYNVSTTEEGVVYTIRYGATGIDVRYEFLDESKFSTVTGTETVEAIDNSKILILNVRASGDYAKGHLKGSLSLPVFSSTGVVKHTKADLAVAFTDYVKANLDTFKAYDYIYIVCNSGASGAKAATVLLTDAGIDLAKVKTVVGGATGKNTDDKSVPNASTFVTPEYALSTLNEDGYLVIDVRSAKNYAAGHLKDSLSLPVFDNDNKLDTDAAKTLAEKFLAYAKANKADLDGKTIYVLCNSGNKGALKAIELLKEAGVDAKVFTIEGGAKTIVKDYFVASRPSSPQTGDSGAVMLYAFAMVAAVIVIARRKEYTK